MPDVVLTSDDTNSYVLNLGEHYYLAEGVTHSVITNDEAIELQGNDHNLYVNGTIVMLGNQSAINALVSTSEDISITVGASGSILGNNAFFGIKTNSNAVVISNAGNIVGGTAIGATGDNTRIFNTGTISSNFTSGAVVFTVDMAGEDAQFNNAGIIQGNFGVTVDHSVEFINSGTITAGSIAIRFNGNFADEIFFSNSGTITSSSAEAIDGGENNGMFINTGDIIGIVDLEGGADTLENAGTITGQVLMAGGDDILINTGQILGDVDLGFGDDTFTNAGTGVVSGTVLGGTGNDTIRGAESDDVIQGDGDDDLIFGNSGEDTLYGGTGEDNIRGGADDDLIDGGTEDDLLRGNGGDDEIYGGDGVDKIYGGAGNDEIYGGAGRDVMRGNSGADTFFFLSDTDANTTDAVDRIRDFEQGLDKIDISSVETFVFVGDAGFSGTQAEVRYQTTNTGLRFEMDVDGDGTADMRVNMNQISDLVESDFIL